MIFFINLMIIIQRILSEHMCISRCNIELMMAVTVILAVFALQCHLLSQLHLTYICLERLSTNDVIKILEKLLQFVVF